MNDDKVASNRCSIIYWWFFPGLQRQQYFFLKCFDISSCQSIFTASALYRKSTEWTEGSVILPISSSSSKLQCAVYCLRYGGESFDYNQADNGCFVYAQKTGWYQVIQ